MTHAHGPAPRRESGAGLLVFSHGGGVQSTAALVLAAAGVLPFREFLFANVGDDSEAPGTLLYLEKWARPYAREHGITLTVLRRRLADGQVETLWGRMMRPGSRALPIPVRFPSGVPARRACTADFKIRVIGRELRRRGASSVNPAVVGVGISVDEVERANTRRAEPYERVVYPLLELGLRRSDCAKVIRGAGLPVPPKSSCFFCPFHRPEAWRTMRRDDPGLFARAADLENTLIRRREAAGKDPVYLSGYGRPLRDAFPDGVDTLPLPGGHEVSGCDGGWCAT